MHLMTRARRPFVLSLLSGVLLSCGGDGPVGPTDPVATKLAFVTAPPSTTSVGLLLSPQPVVQLQDATGAAVSKAGVVVTASLEGGSVSGGTTATTGSNGRATFSGLALSATAGAHTLHFDAPSLTGLLHSVTIQAGSSSAMVANSTTSQTGTAGLPVTARPSVKVSDAAGNPSAGVVVTFAITAGLGSVTDEVQETGPDGVATVGSWVLGMAPGSNRMQATAAGAGGSVTFSATGVLVGQAAKSSADIQIGLAGETVGEGAPKSGALVRFEVARGDGSVSVTETVTDASGKATAGSWSLGATPGENWIEARIPGYSAVPLRFRAWGVSQLPASLEIHAGDGQTVDALEPLPIAPAVRAHDASGEPLAGFPVTFSQLDGTTNGLSGANATTDANGVAAIGAWGFSYSNGEKYLLASAPLLEGSPVQFVATVFDDTPDDVSPVPNDGITAQVGMPVTTLPRVVVTTIGGDRLQGVPVEFAIATGGGTLTGASQLTDANGEASPTSWILGTTSGQQSIMATVALAGSVTMTATAIPGPPAAAVAVKGDNQSGPIYNPLPVDPTIRIQDQYGNATPGKTAVFTVTQGGGTRLQTNQTSNSAGEVSARWTLGGAIGSNQMTVSFPSEPISNVNFSASATAVSSAFDIEVIYVGTPTMAEQEAINAAVARWRTIIQGDIPSLSLNLPAGTCSDNQQDVNQAVDDVIVLVDFSNIDGPGGVLGSAGPCALRSSSRLPAYGTITIDGADAASLAASGELRDVMIHEMGHVLGFGTIWTLKNLLVGENGGDPQYTGLAARQAYHVLGGSQTNVPVENTGGDGTRDSHWRDLVFKNELMTGFIGGTNNPLSKITTRSLVDLGYQIDDATADPLGFTPSLRRDAQAARAQVPVRRLREQPLTGPIILVHPDGTMQKVPR